MNKITWQGGVVILCLFLCLGCSQDESNYTIVEIEGEYDVKLLQNLCCPENGLLRVVVQPSDAILCEDATILLTQNSTANSFSLGIDGLLVPEQCNNGVETFPRAEESISFSQKGNYNLSISIGDWVENTGSLSISDKGCLIDMTTNDGISIKNNALKFIPDHLIWGGLKYEPNNENNYNNFREELFALFENADLENGNYGYLAIEDGVVKLLEHKHDFAVSINFAIEVPDDKIQEFENILSNYENLFEYYFMDYQGNEYF